MVLIMHLSIQCDIDQLEAFSQDLNLGFLPFRSIPPPFIIDILIIEKE